jgi:DDE superfamily endonuclease
LGLISSIHLSNVSKLIKSYRELVWEGADPELDERLQNLDKDCQLSIDATEQKIKRPKRKKKCYYSGKKKFHTIGTQIATESERNLVVHVSKSYPGAVHDYEIFKRSKIANKIPEGIKIDLDSGYQGINGDYLGLKATIPYKKNRGKKKLNAKGKKHNRALSSRRIKVEQVCHVRHTEHANCRIKEYEVINGVYRMNPEHYNQDFRNVVSCNS